MSRKKYRVVHLFYKMSKNKPKTEDIFKAEVGERLKEFYKKHKGIKWATQEDFGKLIGVHKSDLRLYFNGVSAFSAYKLYVLSQYDCNIHWLLTGDESPEKIELEEIKRKLTSITS